MTKFIDTEAGRQLLKEHFQYEERDVEELIDPNFLEWADEHAMVPIIKDIQKLFRYWERKGTEDFEDLVKKYFEINKWSGTCAMTYLNLVEFCNSHTDPLEYYTEGDDKLPDELALSLRDTTYYYDDERTSYNDCFSFDYTEEYLEHLKSLVS